MDAHAASHSIYDALARALPLDGQQPGRAHHPAPRLALGVQVIHDAKMARATLIFELNLRKAGPIHETMPLWA